jgi:hypothetical protein
MRAELVPFETDTRQRRVLREQGNEAGTGVCVQTAVIEIERRERGIAKQRVH